MIINSTHWKTDLQKESEDIDSYFETIDFSNNDDSQDGDDDLYNLAFIKLQKFAIYSAIVIRKLVEANKISDELIGENFQIKKFLKNSTRKVTFLNGYELEILYDIKNPEKLNTNLKRLTDDIIHSFHFIPEYNWQKIDISIEDSNVENWKNNGLLGFYLSTDKSKEKYVQFIDFKTFINIVKKVIRDYITFAQLKDGEVVKKTKS